MRMLRCIFVVALIFALSQIDAKADEEFLSKDEFLATHIGVPLVGTTFRGYDTTYELHKDGTAEWKSFATGGSEDYGDTGHWKILENGILGLKFSNWKRMYYRKIRKTGPKYEMLGKVSGKVYFTYYLPSGNKK